MSVSNATASVAFTPVASNVNALIQVRVNGGGFTGVSSGQSSGPLALNVGLNTVDLLVTAQDGMTTNTYSIGVTRRTVFGDWALANGVPNDVNAIGANGLGNLLNFGFGFNPNGTARGALIFNGTFGGGGTIGALGQPITRSEPITNGVDRRALYVRRKDYLSAGLNYATEFSSDLSGWTLSTDVPTVLADDGVYQIVSVPYPPLQGGKNTEFFHVRVTQSP
jgi:hypothetical protein